MTYWVHKWTALSERGRFLLFVTKDLDLLNKLVWDYRQNSNANCGFTMMFLGLLLISTACFACQDSKMVRYYFVAQTVPEFQAFLWQSLDGFWYFSTLKRIWEGFTRTLRELWNKWEDFERALKELWKNFERILKELCKNFERRERILRELWKIFERTLRVSWKNFDIGLIKSVTESVSESVSD